MKRFFCLALLAMMSLMLCAQEVMNIRPSQNIRFIGKSLKVSQDITWVFWDESMEDGKYDVFGMKYAANGSALLAEPLSLLNGVLSVNLLRSIPTSDGNFALGYRSELQSGLWAFTVQKFSPDGMALWSAEGIQIGQPENYYDCDIYMVANGQGGVHLVYTYQDQFRLLSLNASGTNTFIENLSYSIPGYTELVDVHPDGSGGLFIHANSDSGSALLRISETGNVQGSNPLIASSAATPAKFWLVPDSLGQFILYGRNMATGLPTFSFQKMDANGNLLWASPKQHTFPELNFNLRMFGLLPAMGGEAYLVSVFQEDYPNSQNRIRVLKMKANMEAAWENSGIVIRDVPYLINDLALAINANNDLWLSWAEAEAGYQNATIYAQMVHAGGTLGCPTQTLSSSVNTKLKPVLQAKADKALLWWNDFSGDTNSVKHQIITNSGVQAYNPGGVQLSAKMAGSAWVKYCLGLQDKHLLVWMDSRWGYKDKVYYQLVADQPLLEAAGRVLNPESLLLEELYDAVVTPRNTIALYYSVMGSTFLNYYLQEIDANGSRLYPGFGIQVRSTNLNSVWGYLGVDGNDVYVFWREESSGYPNPIITICGQRINTGQTMWETGGKVIYPGSLVNVNIIEVQGTYIIISSQSVNENFQTLVLKTDINGNPMPGFGSTGINPQGENLPEDTAQYLQQSWLLGENLALLIGNWGSSALSGISYYQLILPTGELAIEEPGSLVLENDAYILAPIDRQYSDFRGFTFTSYWDEAIYFQGIDAAGNLQFPISGNEIFHDSLALIGSPRLINYADGSYSAFSLSFTPDRLWSVQNTILNPNGEVAHTETLISRYDLSGNLLAGNNDSTVMLMGQARIANYNREDTSLKGIWALKVNSSSPIDDPLLPQIPEITISQNYPNPFGQDTTISYSLSKANNVEISVYNVKGALVRKWHSSAKEAGQHSVTWDAKDALGQRVSAGLYFYKVKAGGQSLTRKMVILK